MQVRRCFFFSDFGCASCHFCASSSGHAHLETRWFSPTWRISFWFILIVWATKIGLVSEVSKTVLSSFNISFLIRIQFKPIHLFHFTQPFLVIWSIALNYFFLYNILDSESNRVDWWNSWWLSCSTLHSILLLCWHHNWLMGEVQYTSSSPCVIT